MQPLDSLDNQLPDQDSNGDINNELQPYWAANDDSDIKVGGCINS